MLLGLVHVNMGSMSPHDPVLDSLLALTWAAAHTTTIRLATGIVILPQRNPVVLAKQVATLDVLSGGRLMLGVGAGYLEAEFRAVGASFAQRGAVTDEHLDAMQTLWYDEHPEYHGRFADFAAIDARPRPLQRPIPLVVAGHSAPAYRGRSRGRTAGTGTGSPPMTSPPRSPAFAPPPTGSTGPAALGELEISVTPRDPVTPGQAAEFAEAGVHRLVFLAPQTQTAPPRQSTPPSPR